MRAQTTTHVTLSDVETGDLLVTARVTPGVVAPVTTVYVGGSRLVIDGTKELHTRFVADYMNAVNAAHGAPDVDDVERLDRIDNDLSWIRRHPNATDPVKACVAVIRAWINDQLNGDR